VSESSPSSLDILLRNLGFVRGNPFETHEADKEAALGWLHEAFIEPPHFDDVVGDARLPQSMIIFAPRGTGKTALRVMVHHFCRRDLVPHGPVLSILHTDLSLIQETALRDPQADLARHHVQAILRAGIVALADRIEVTPSLRERLVALPAEERTYLGWFVESFGDDLSPRQWRHLREAELATSAGMGFLRSHHPGGVHELREFLSGDQTRSYVQLLKSFVSLVLELQFQAIYVLVDGADELATTAAEYGLAASIVEPLAANLKLLDMPGVAFRLYLPAEIRPSLDAAESVRYDRVRPVAMEWAPEQLLELLQKRLDVFSEGHVTSLDAICTDALAQGRLEQALVTEAGGSPRQLLRLGQALLDEQAKIVSMDEHADWRLRTEAWERARALLVQPRRSRLPDLPYPGESHGSGPFVPYEILTLYPSPIALVLRDYLIKQEPMVRLQRLVDAFEITIGFCSALMLSQYEQQREEARYQGRRTRSVGSIIRMRKRRPQMTLGNWMYVLEQVVPLSGNLGRSQMGSQLQRLLNTEAGTAVQRLLELRNILAHQAKPSTYYVERLPLAHADLLTVLTSLDLLGETLLFQPLTSTRQGDEHLHLIRRYQGDNPLFAEEHWKLTGSLDCDRLWFKQKETVLRVLPFLVAERCQACGYHEVFIYQRHDGRNLEYHSFASGHSLVTAQYRPEVDELLGLS
jgi:hypothetical protein